MNEIRKDKRMKKDMENDKREQIQKKTKQSFNQQQFPTQFKFS